MERPKEKTSAEKKNPIPSKSSALVYSANEIKEVFSQHQTSNAIPGKVLFSLILPRRLSNLKIRFFFRQENV
jgi:hypothetical protein